MTAVFARARFFVYMNRDCVGAGRPGQVQLSNSASLHMSAVSHCISQMCF